MRGTGRVFKRKNSNNWWISYCHRGKEYRETSGSTDRKQAEKLLKQRLQEIGADRLGLKRFVGPAQDRVTVGELLDTLEQGYRLQEGRAMPQFLAHLRPISAAFGDRRAVDVTEEVADRYITQRLEEGKAPATVNRETQLLGQAFRLAVERKRLSAAPRIRRLPERNARQGFFERGEFEAVLAHLPTDLQDFARFAYVTGWRKGEVASLAWADVDRDGRAIRLRPDSSKTGEARLVVLEGVLWTIIERRWTAREYQGLQGEAVLSSYIFHRNGAPIGDIRKAWASACKKAGLAGKLFHDLRRTAIRNMVRAGVPERVTMDISGHRTRAVFDRYNITSERDLREAVRRTEEHLKAQSMERSVLPFPQAMEVGSR